MKIKILVGSGSVLLCLSSPKQADVFSVLDVLLLHFCSAGQGAQSAALPVPRHLPDVCKNQPVYAGF